MSFEKHSSESVFWQIGISANHLNFHREKIFFCKQIIKLCQEGAIVKYQPIQANEFTSFVRTLQGQKIPTTSRKKIFTVDVVGDDMKFTPMSSGKVRQHQRKYVEKVLGLFNETQSFTQTIYQDNGIINAAYIVTLISMYIEADKHLLQK